MNKGTQAQKHPKRGGWKGNHKDNSHHHQEHEKFVEHQRLGRKHQHWDTEQKTWLHE